MGIVIAGGGLAAQRAVETLRRSGHDGPHPPRQRRAVAPYDRPPLSKEYLAGRVDEAALRFRADDWYRDRDVELLARRARSALDVAARELTLASGCATAVLAAADRHRQRARAGCRAPSASRTSTCCERIADARRLRTALLPGARLVVIGAGFIGQEVASTARRLGAEVTIVEARRSAARSGPRRRARRLVRAAAPRRGHRVRLSARITQLHGRDAVRRSSSTTAAASTATLVVVGIGTVPATAWLAGSGLDDGGVPVDAAGRTRVPGIYAAGDAAEHFDARLGAHVRTEHWEAAARQGAAARPRDARPRPCRRRPSRASGATSTASASNTSATRTAPTTSGSTATPTHATSPPPSPDDGRPSRAAGRAPPRPAGIRRQIEQPPTPPERNAA